MNEAHIFINGVIGSYFEPSGEIVKGVELLDIIAQVKANKDANKYVVHIKSPGGLVDTGDQIFDYLESLKATAQVDTITDGDVGSIATKLFLVGQNRTIIDGHQFFIHNPWTQHVHGDSNEINVELEALKQAEAALRKFYVKATGITEEGLKGLMDNETGMTAEQAVQLGFATIRISKEPVKAFALLKSKATMTKTKNTATLGQQIGSIIDKALGNKPTQIKALSVDLADGTKLYVDTEDPAGMVGSAVFIADEGGNPTEQAAPDGEHALADGQVVVVAGGVITEVKPAEAPAEGEMSARITALEEKINALVEAQSSQVNVKDEIANALNELKSSIKVGQAPPRGVNSNKPAPAQQQRKLSPIQAKMKANIEKSTTK